MSARFKSFLIIFFSSVFILISFQNCSEEPFDPNAYNEGPSVLATPSPVPSATPTPTPVLIANGNLCVNNSDCVSNRCSAGPGVNSNYCRAIDNECAQAGTSGARAGQTRVYLNQTFTCLSNGVWQYVPPSPTPSVTPTPTPSNVQISAGFYYTCAIDTDGKAYCWGDDTYGQLGDIRQTSPAPTPPMLYDYRAPVQVNITEKLTQIVSGNYHNCALTINKEVYCWGLKNRGQTGDGLTIVATNATANNPMPIKVSGLANVEQLAAAHSSTCARVVDGRVFCWGQAYNYQLGNGSLVDTSVPVPVTGLQATKHLMGGGKNESSYGAQGRYCVIKLDNTLHCWGYNGNTALSSVTPQFGTTNNFDTGDITSNFGCLIALDKKLSCWGVNGYYQLGSKNNLSGSAYGPLASSSLLLVNYLSSPILADKVAVGRDHACAISGASVYCWGRNDYGQAGRGGGNTVTSPLPIALNSGSALPVSIAAGMDHTCVAFNDSTIKCFGRNDEGQLGRNNVNNETTYRSTPQLVNPPFDL